jgi:hypothetical protein
MMYTQSDVASITVSPEGHGGCGQAHVRDVDESGYPVQPWGVSCPECEPYLRTDKQWAATVDDIPPTHDEKKAAEKFRERGQQDKDALLVLAMSRMAGVSAAEIPPTLTKMLTGLPAHVPGVTVCSTGHENMPGSRFCRQCGTSMARPAAAGEIGPGAAS